MECISGAFVPQAALFIGIAHMHESVISEVSFFMPFAYAALINKCNEVIFENAELDSDQEILR